MRRREGLAVLACDAPVALRDCPGPEARVSRLCVVPPVPLPAVLVVPGRAVEVPARVANHGGHLVREVLILRLEGRGREDLPEDLVGLSAPRLPQVRQEHEVLAGPLVELEGHEDVHPEGHGGRPDTALHGAPRLRDGPVDPLEEPVLEVPEDLRVRVDPEEPEGPVVAFVLVIVVLIPAGMRVSCVVLAWVLWPLRFIRWCLLALGPPVDTTSGNRRRRRSCRHPRMCWRPPVEALAITRA